MTKTKKIILLLFIFNLIVITNVIATSSQNIVLENEVTNNITIDNTIIDNVIEGNIINSNNVIVENKVNENTLVLEKESSLLNTVNNSNNDLLTEEQNKALVEKKSTSNKKELKEVNGVWRMVINGKVDYNYTGLGTNANGTYYFENGKITFNYKGTIFENNKAYVIERSKVWVTCTSNTNEVMLINNVWRMVKNGEVDYKYTGIGSNSKGTWYLQNGTVTFNYTGVAKTNSGDYIVVGSKVKTDTTEIILMNAVYRMVVKGKIEYNYTGLGSNSNGIYYFENGEITFNYKGTIFEGDKAYIVEKSKVWETCTKNTTEIMLINKVYRMVINGKVDYNYTGLGTNTNGTYYFENGEITFNYKGTIFEGDKAYIVEKSKVWETCTKNTTEIMLINKIYRMVISGKVDYNYTGLGTNANGTYYFQKGIITFKYDGIYDDSTGTYILKSSKLQSSVTEIMLINKIYRMVINGKVDYNYTGLGTNTNGTYYFENGEITFKYKGTIYEGNRAYIIENSKVKVDLPTTGTEVVNIDGTWRLVKDGKIDYNYTGLGTNKNGTWYLEKGEVTFKYNGTYKDSTGTYVIKGSQVQLNSTEIMLIDNVWRMVIKGKVDYTYTGLGTNANGTYYLQNGEITFAYKGTIYEGNTAYIIEKSKVWVTCTQSTTGLMQINGTWRMVINGKVDYNYTGVIYNENGGWILQNGTINFNYNGEYTNIDGSVYGIAKGKVNEVIKNIHYPGTMWVDSPIKNNKYRAGTLNVSGWVLSTEKSETVQVLLDGKWVGVASRKERPDVFEVYNKGEYGGRESNLLPGFTLDINTSGLSKGTHTLEIINLTSNGVTIQSRKIEFAITDLTKSKGIDVSHYNGNINWNLVKNSGEVEFAILKIGEWHESKKQLVIDDHFESYYNECKRLGIAVGGYFYSYAFNGAEASREAAECLSVIRGKHFEMPIFLDVEDDILKNAVKNGKTNRDELTNASITFCDALNNAGYRSGVYASKNFFRDYLNAPVLERYNIWLAHYTTSTDYTGKYDLWQWTSDGIVSGITGRVDLDWCFTRYY